MCFGHALPYGIPITDELHNQFPDEVKQAWEIFHAWWQEQHEFAGPPSRKNMPKDVEKAMNKILEAPIPGYEEEGFTGKDSCYMIGVHSRMAD
jgi:hypothetical protein